MQHLAQKLKSRRGASMLFALLVFFLCLLAGVAALTAAAANVGRYTHLEGEQQQYYSVASALELLQAQLDAAAEIDPTATPPTDLPPLTVRATFTETQEWWYEASVDSSGKTTYTPQSTTSYKLELDPAATDNPNYFQRLLLNNCVPEEWVTKQTVTPGVALPTVPTNTTPYQYTIKPYATSGTPDWAASIFPVEVDVQAAGGDGYVLKMTLTPKDNSAYKLNVVWSGVAETQTDTTTETTGEIPATPPASADSRGTRTTTTVLTCTLHLSAENREVTFG